MSTHNKWSPFIINQIHSIGLSDLFKLENPKCSTNYSIINNNLHEGKVKRLCIISIICIDKQNSRYFKVSDEYHISYLTVFPGEVAVNRPEVLSTVAMASSILVYSTKAPIVGPPFIVS